METYIALLRGINVSGKNIIKMEALRLILETSNFKNIKTYIQSGNIIFETKRTSLNKLEEVITSLIKINFDFEVPVFVIKVADLQDVINKSPFQDSFTEKLHITFLHGVPNKNNIQKISGDFGDDLFKIIDNVVYIYCPNGYGNTKLHNTYLEKKLALKATTRNWKTCNTLLNMAD
jgi:uncharacterized protein (DUF1697 family)